MNCPKCGDPLTVHGTCGSCGYGQQRTGEPIEAQRRREFNDKIVRAARERLGQSSLDLTEKQWYAVCKFWPNVARRSKRSFADVGPHNPLDSVVELGPMFARRTVLAEALAEREAIQNVESQLAKREAERINQLHLSDSESLAEREAIQAE